MSTSRTWCGRHRCCREANHDGACEVDELELTGIQMRAIREGAIPNPYRSQA